MNGPGSGRGGEGVRGSSTWLTTRGQVITRDNDEASQRAFSYFNLRPFRSSSPQKLVRRRDLLAFLDLSPVNPQGRAGVSSFIRH